jgi:hypothetical protein
MRVYKTHISLGYAVAVPIEVHYTAHPAIRGSFEPAGCQIEPDEPAHIEIESVTTNGYLVNLSKPDERALRDEIAAYLDDADDFAQSEHADRMREERRDR